MPPDRLKRKTKRLRDPASEDMARQFPREGLAAHVVRAGRGGPGKPLNGGDGNGEKHLLLFGAEAEAALQLDLHRKQRVRDLVGLQTLGRQEGFFIDAERLRRRHSGRRHRRGLAGRRRVRWPETHRAKSLGDDIFERLGTFMPTR